jgi:hypothetical protein
MTAEETASLLARLAQSEDPWVERKQSYNELEARRTVVGFANSLTEGQTAVMFIGADNKGQHKGVSDADDLQKKIAGIMQRCYPPIAYQTCVLPVEVGSRGLEILAILVGWSTHRPHFAGPAYIRRGSETIEASREVFLELIASQNDKARRILQHKGQRVMLRFRSESGFSFDEEGVVQSCDAITVTIRDQEMSLWSFPIPEVQIYEEKPFFLVVTVQPRWTEDEQIRRMVRRWAGPRAAQKADALHLHREDPMVAQLLANPGKALPAVAAETDGTANMALKSLLVHVRFELKKIASPMPRQQKLKRLETLYFQTLAKCGPPSGSSLVGASVQAITEVATSLEEADEFLKRLARDNPGLAKVPFTTVWQALLWQLGFA